MVDQVLLSKCRILTMKNGNLSLLLKSLETNTPSSVLMARSKNVAWVPQCSSFSSNSLGRNSLKGRNFCHDKLLRNLFLRMRHEKNVFCGVSFCDLGILWKKCGIYFCNPNILTKYFLSKSKKKVRYNGKNLYAFCIRISTL